MADKGGVLGSNSSRSKTIVSHQKEKEKIHFIFMRSLGKVHSMRVSYRYLLAFALFLFCFVIFSIIIINNYLNLYVENEALRENNVRLAHLVNDYKLKSQLASQYQLLIDELNQAEPTSRLASAEKSLPQRTVSKLKTQTKPRPETKPLTKAAEKKPAETLQGPPVDVSDLILKTDAANQVINFSFNLRKIVKEIDLVSGYMIVILENRRVSPPEIVCFPASIKVVNGAPSNFRRGQQFAIRHGKIVKGVINRVRNAKDFSLATIFAYSFKGELLLRKSITVADDKKTS